MPAALWCAGISVAYGAAGAIHLVQKPAMSKTEIVFSYAGDLWRVKREGGAATRLTSGPGFETEAAFSPDGNTLAFTGEYDGNVDVFTVPAAGGIPKRVTYHPDADRVAGWSPDGARILFRSNRASHSRYTQLYTVAAAGGLAEALPLPMACMGAYSPDGKRMVYAPLDGGQFAPGFTNYVAWKRYRGGSASYLWLVNFADLTTVKIPRTDSNDIFPMWAGDKVYFLSDRNGPMTLFRYDPQSKQVTELIKNTGKDIVSASAGPGGIVYEQFGQIHIYDIAAGKEHAVAIEITADLTEVRPRFQNVTRELRNAAISPTGARAVFEAHGEILTVPAEKGEMRNLTNTPGVMERTPVWAPDGKSIAFFSDESGEYALHIKAQNGAGETKKIQLAGKSAFYFDPEVVAGQQEHCVQRQHGQPLDGGRGIGQDDQGGYRYHLHAGAGLQLVGGFEVDRVRAVPAEPDARHFRLLHGDWNQRAGDGRNERCAASGVRPRRAVSVFHGEHELRAHLERARYEQRRTPGDQQRVPGGAAQQHRVAAGAGKR